MRVTILILLTNYCICFSQETEKLDTLIVNCIVTNFQYHNFDIKSDLLDFESKLIRDKYLDDNSGKSYLRIYERTKELDDMDIFRDYSYSSLDSVSMTEFTKCYDKELILKSKGPFQNLFHEFEKVTPGEATPGLAATIILESFTSKDYELQSVRFYCLYTFYKISMSNKWLGAALPMLENEEEFLEYGKEYLTINHWRNDSISIYGQPIEKVELSERIKEFLSQKVDHTVLIVEYKTSREVLHRDFLTVLDLINREINSLNNSIATNTFNRAYDELTQEEKKTIRVKYPVKKNFGLIE